MSTQEDSRLVVTFENHSILNEAQSKLKGRPIFEDMEVCRIRMGGDRQNSPVFPAWAEAPGGMMSEDGYAIPATYKEKYAAQYKQFKAGEIQTKAGTPIDALPFLTPAKMKELKGLHIYTAESLASLDGANLKSLGQDGRSWKNQAQAYLDNAAGSAVATRLADENAFLRQQLEELQRAQVQPAQPAQPVDEEPAASQFDGWEDDLLKEYIAEKTGSKPRGNPSHETLVRMAEEVADQ